MAEDSGNGRSRRRPYGTGSLFQRNGSWFGQWRVGGRLVKRKLGPVRSTGAANGLTRRQAEDRLRSLMSSVRAGRAGHTATVAELAEAYMEHIGTLGRKRSTLQDYRWITERHFEPFFGDRAASRVDASIVRLYVQAKRSAGLSAKTIRNQLALLNAVFTFGVRREVLTDNPVQRVERPRDEATETGIRFLTMEEVRALLLSCPSGPMGPLDRDLFATAVMTGLRQGELLALRWKDVDFKAGVVRVRRAYTRGAWTSPKSRRGVRAVPLPDEIRTALARLRTTSAYAADEELVFAHPLTGNVLDASRLRKRFKAALEQAGLRSVRFHDLRHTYGTLMAGAGTPLRVLQEWMGHRDYQTTLIYADYAPDEGRGVHFTRLAFGASDSAAQ